MPVWRRTQTLVVVNSERKKLLLNVKRAQSKQLYCVQPYTETQTKKNSESSQKMKRQEFFSWGKLERALCRVALMVHNTHIYGLKLETEKGGKEGMRLASLFALSRSYIAWLSQLIVKRGRKERERGRVRCCLAIACCVVYTSSWAHNKLVYRRRKDVYLLNFPNADLALVEI